MGAATLLVYVAIFPLLQMLYMRFVLPDHSKRPKIQGHDERSPLMEEQGLHHHPKVNISDSNIKDMRFFLFGAVLYVIGYVIVVKNERAMVVFLGRGSLSAEESHLCYLICPLIKVTNFFLYFFSSSFGYK